MKNNVIAALLPSGLIYCFSFCCYVIMNYLLESLPAIIGFIGNTQTDTLRILEQWRTISVSSHHYKHSPADGEDGSIHST